MRITESYLSGLSIVVQNEEQLKRLFGFEINLVSLDVLKNGWLCASVNWIGKKNGCCLKYPELYGRDINDYYYSLEFGFPDADKLKKRKLNNISIYLKSKHLLRHEYLFYVDTKYGVAIYYAPDGWDEIKKVLNEKGPRFDVPQVECDVDPNSTKEDGDKALMEYIENIRSKPLIQ